MTYAELEYLEDHGILKSRMGNEFSVVSWNVQEQEEKRKLCGPREWCFSIDCVGHNPDTIPLKLYDDSVPAIEISGSNFDYYNDCGFSAYLPLPSGIMTQSLKALHDHSLEFEDIRDEFCAPMFNKPELVPKFRTVGGRHRFKDFNTYYQAVKARF